MDPFSSDPYKAKEIDVTKAKVDLAETKRQLEQSVRTMYNTIKQLEAQYGALQTNLTKAEQGLKMVQAKYDVGMAIMPEVTETELKVAQIKQLMFSVVTQLDLLNTAIAEWSALVEYSSVVTTDK